MAFREGVGEANGDVKRHLQMCFLLLYVSAGVSKNEGQNGVIENEMRSISILC